MIKIAEIEGVAYKPTPKNIQAELDRLGLTQAQGAELIRINERTMRRYLQEPGTVGSTPMPFGSFALLRLAKAGAR